MPSRVITMPGWLTAMDAGPPPIIRRVFTASSVRSTRAIMADPRRSQCPESPAPIRDWPAHFKGYDPQDTLRIGTLGTLSGHWERCRDIGNALRDIRNKLSGHQEQAFGTLGTNYRDIGNARNF